MNGGWCVQDEFSLLTRTFLVQELDKSFNERRDLIAYATKLNNDIAQLEKDRPPSAETGVTVNHKEPSGPPPAARPNVVTDTPSLPPPPPANFKSPTGRRRRNTKRDAARNKTPAAEVDLATISRPLVIPASTAAALMFRPAQLHLPELMARTVNGNVIPDLSPVGLLAHARALQQHHVVDNHRPGSSSSTDSAESVRHLEQGACVSNLEHFTSSSSSVNRNGGTPIVAHSVNISRLEDLPHGTSLIPPPLLTTRVSFPSSQSEMEQYKLMVHGSAIVPSNTALNLNTRSSTNNASVKPPTRRGRKRASDSTGSAGDSTLVTAPLMLSSFPPGAAINLNLANYLSQHTAQKVFGNPQFGVLPSERLEVRSECPRQFVVPACRPDSKFSC